MKNMNKWFYAFVGVAVALVIAIIVAIVVGVNAGKTPDEIPEGAETGIYYYDADDGEWTVHLHSGNQFTLNDGVARVGEYTVDGTTISFTFKKESNGTATAQYADGVLTMTYNGQQIRFLEKVSYTVTYDAQGGSATASATVINGKTADKPADPTRTGYAFIGWFTDSALTKPFVFGSSIITSDTTLYAGWVEKSVGQVEYTVDFVGADVESMTTHGGKVFGLPTPEKSGYTFGGWWISAYEDAEKLTYKCEEGTALTANTTLFAVWTADTGSKLSAPMVQVTESGISWGAVSGAAAYAVKITAPDGTVVFNDNVSATSKNVEFAVAGCYTVEVSAVAANSANNSDTTVRYYAAKTLNRVSLFEVIEPSVLLFNAVDGAQKYYVTVKCGNPDHNHTNFDNGNSTVYSFANCAMTAEGIEFTVTAAANGYASSVSETFVYVRALDAVTDITVNEDETLVWNPVPGAAYYAVKITCGEHGTHIVNVNTASLSIKGCSGSVAVEVTPVTEGYASPAATAYTYTKATLAAPIGVTVNGTVVSWAGVQNATSYTVKVGSKTFTTSTASIDLSEVDLDLEAGADVEISVMAEGAGKTSLYSDAISTKYLTFVGNVVYANGIVSWTPAIGAGYYEVKVDNGATATVNAASTVVSFTSAGKHTVSVRFVGSTVASEWYTVDVTVYAIIFDSRLGSAVDPIYVAAGDMVNITGVPTRPGYSFDGWYTTPNAASGNGKLYTETYYGAQDDTVLYAQWQANTYNVVYSGDSSVTGNGEAVFNQKFELSVPTSDTGSFLGWYSGPGGTGWQVTDAYGKSIGKYNTVGDLTVYPLFETGTLKYVEQPDGTWAVTAGPNIHNVTDVIVPQSYQGAIVTTVLENAFKSCTDLKTVSFPNTVTVVGTGAFTGCYDLEAINVREVEGVQEPVYSSYDGALIRKDIDGTVYLEYFPMGKKGEYTIPAGVDTIRNNAFRYSYYLTKVTVSEDVTYVADQAFINCPLLEDITFVSGGNKNLTVEVGAFENCKKLAAITLPARLVSIDTASLDVLPKLSAVNVEAGGSVYGSVDGMLTNADRDTIVYCPNVKAGELVVPVGVTAIGDGAFANRDDITSLVISNKVTSIGASAFENCTGLSSVVFAGGRNVDLVIGEGAFKGCTGINTLTFAGAASSRSASAQLDAGTITIGASAFEGCSAITALNIEDGANVVSIGASAFKGCSKIPAVVIPATVSSIGDSAYADCTNVSSVTFEENGTAIDFGASVFAGCSKLKSIYLPATITTFDGSVFNGCGAIAEIVVDDDNPILMAEGGILYNKAQTEILYYPKAVDVDFTALPATINKISAAAFQGNAVISEVVIPAAITEIGANAFDNCVNLSSVTFENLTGNVKIGEYAFANCPALTGITLPAGMTELSAYTFYKSGLTAFAIPAGVATIGEYAIANTQITEIEITPNVTLIKDGAFSNCKKLATVTVAEGDKLLSIGTLDDTKGVFRGDTKLKTFNFSTRTNVIGAYAFYDGYLTTANIPEGSKLVTIGYGAFYYDSITTINLPEGLRTIGEKAFHKSSLAGEIVIPSTVESIGTYAFANAKATSYKFAEGTAELSIADYAFANNSNLTSVDLPARLESIYSSTVVGYYGIPVTSFYTVFDNCSKLAAINVADDCEKFSDINGIFCENDENGKPVTVIFCPRGYAGEVTIPSTVTLISNIAFNGVNSVTKVTFDEIADWDGVPTLDIGSHAGDWNVSEDKSYVVFKSTSITEISLPKHLKAINGGAFYELTAAGLKIDFAEGTKGIALGQYAIYGNTNLASVELPPITKISVASIYFNRGLTTLTFGEGSTLDTIAMRAIWNNAALTTFEVPASVKTIDTYAFWGNTLLSVTFAEGSQLTSIGSSAFYSTGLSSFTFPESVTEVGSGLFDSCRNLTTVTLSAKMISALGNDGGAIFANAPAISTVIVPDTNKHLVVKDGILYDKSLSVLMYCPPKMDHSGVSIPDTVTSIEAYAFYNFTGTELTLPAGLVKIGNNAFQGASQLTALTIPASVKSIGNHVFTSTSSLKSFTFAEGSVLETVGDRVFYGSGITEIDIPDTVTSLGEQFFSNCKDLVRVDLSTSLTEIAPYFFDNCESLVDVTIHEGVRTIGEGAFYYCEALESIEIPASVVELVCEFTVSYGVFQSCSSLKTVTFAEGSKLETLGYNTFRNCESLETITLPKQVTNVPGEVFYACDSLTEVVFEGELAAIPAGIFAGKTQLTTVVIPETVTAIGANAFDGCTSLVNVTIPEGIESIGEGAFRGCASLKSVTVGESIEEIGAYAFDGCSGLESFTFASDVELISLSEGMLRGTTSLVAVELPATVKTIGASILADSGINSIELPASLTAVSDNAFAGCVNLEKVVIPSTVKGIGNYAFEGCTSLTEADIEFGVESIGAGAFLDCTALEKVNVPLTVSNIAGNPFINCPALADLDLDENNEMYKFVDGALYDSEMQTLIYYLPGNEDETFQIPASVITLGAGAFYGSQLKSIVIPDTITNIPDMLFMNSSKLESVVIGKSVTNIGSKAFQGCTSLVEVTVPARVATVGEYAFAGATSLTGVTFDARDESYSIGAHAFEGCSKLTALNITDTFTGYTDYMLAGTGFETYTIPDFITDLNVEGLFANCASLTGVTFHAGVEGILGNRFFYNCAALESVELPELINALGEWEYDGYDYTDDGIWDMAMGYNCTIVTETFAGCTSLTSIDLTNVYHVGARTFDGCTALEEIIFGDYINVVGDYAFANCTALEIFDMTSVYDYINDEYASPSIGAHLFSGCTALKEVYFPEVAFNYVEDDLFDGCTSLTYVQIRDMTYFGRGAAPFKSLRPDAIVHFAWYDADTMMDWMVYSSSDWHDFSYYDATEWYQQTEATLVCEDGSIINNDGSISYFARGIDAAGNVTTGTGAKIDAEGNVVFTVTFEIARTTREITYPEGYDTLPLGITVDGEGNVKFADGTVIDAAGNVTYGEGVTKLPAGVSKNYYGAVTINVDIVVKADRTVVYPEGLNKLPVGVTVEGGVVTLDDGTVVAADGTITFTDGATVSADKVVTLVGGTTVSDRYVYWTVDGKYVVMPECFQGV